MWSIGLVLVLAGCRFSLDPDVDPNRDGGGFVCANDADCGGGWHCNLACSTAAFVPYCLPNGECDPCPSLLSDRQNCGACGNVCTPGAVCFSGICVPPPT